jgi:hypothetical protein
MQRFIQVEHIVRQLVTLEVQRQAEVEKKARETEAKARKMLEGM